MKKVEMLLWIIIAVTFSHLVMPKSVEEEKIEQVKIGNFALPTSQQAGPMIGFGQNLPGKNVFQEFTYYDRLKSSHASFNLIVPSLLYGVVDRFSVLAQFPIAAKFRSERVSSHGVGDFVLQIEGAAFLKESSTSVDEITLVTNISVPTGSVTKNPPTGFGAPAFFLGFTAARTTVQWYYFTSMGVGLPTSHKGTKIGNQFLYQYGFGGNILYSPDNYLFNWLVELDGIYVQRSKIAGKINCNTGSNTVFLGPSLWFSTRHIFLQAGISAVISQHLFGDQAGHREKYLFDIGIGITF